ncbi:VanZ family protein [Paenibacillus sp. MCAF9]|uniref:VanZ family protein n=1 Tax=Paenibacillus sp. MCAF9 TaxID=3233046 RepID=UPI003F97B7B0
MYQGKQRKMIILLLVLYTVLIFYFLYAGFNRAASIHDSGLRYNLIPEKIHLFLPMQREFSFSLFEFGNFAAFIPFGIMIPLLFRSRFLSFILLFIVSITMLETLQMFSRLGSFDINDIIINTLGAAVGYCAQRFVRHERDTFKGFCKIIITAFVLAIGVIGSIGGINNYLDKASSEVIALDKLPLKAGTVLWDKSLSSFPAAQENVEPKLNMYSRNNTRTNEFTYLLDGKYHMIAGNLAISKTLTQSAGNGNIDLIFSADGTVIHSFGWSFDGQEELPSEFFQIPLDGAKELTIKFVNHTSDRDVLLWDIALHKVNAGQKIINGIKQKLKTLF